MKKRFSEEQIIRILREAETQGNNLDVCRKYGISEQTCYHWRRQYQGLSVSEPQRLKRLEAENPTLKRLVAGPALALQSLQELIKKGGCCEPASRSGAGTEGHGPLRAPGLWLGRAGPLQLSVSTAPAVV